MDRIIGSIFSSSCKSCNPVKKSCRCRGFTLLEVLLAMGIVTMLVLMIGNMFQQVSSSWNVGTQSAEMNTAGRAAVEFIARELSQAVAGPIEAPQLGGAANLMFSLQLNGGQPDLRFVALSADPDSSHRTFREVYFWQEGSITNLKYYHSSSTPLACYSSETWYNTGPASSQRLIDNVNLFAVYTYANEGALVNNQYTDTYVSNRLPLCADIFLEVLGSDDAAKASQLSGADKTAFIARNSRRYTSRVYFPNRQGYQGR